MKKISAIVLFFFIFSLLMPLQATAAGKKKKKVPAVVEKKVERNYLKGIISVYPPLPFQEGEEIAILREDVSVIVRDGTGKIREGWIPSGTIIVVQIIIEGDRKEKEIVRLYESGASVLNKVLLKDLQKPPQIIGGEKLKLMQKQEKEETPPSKKEPANKSIFAFLGEREKTIETKDPVKKRCIDWDSAGLFLGTGFAAYGIFSEQHGFTGAGIVIDVTSLFYDKKKKEKTSVGCQALSFFAGGIAGWGIAKLTKKDDDEEESSSSSGGNGGGGGGSGHPAPP